MIKFENNIDKDDKEQVKKFMQQREELVRRMDIEGLIQWYNVYKNLRSGRFLWPAEKNFYRSLHKIMKCPICHREFMRRGWKQKVCNNCKPQTKKYRVCVVCGKHYRKKGKVLTCSSLCQNQLDEIRRREKIEEKWKKLKEKYYDLIDPSLILNSKAMLTRPKNQYLNKFGFVYEPTNEQEVVVLFFRMMEKLGFTKIVKIQTQFPDAYVEYKDGSIKKVEFEYVSSNFLTHLKNEKHFKTKGCDYVVCWKIDISLPSYIKIIELSSVLK